MKPLYIFSICLCILVAAVSVAGYRQAEIFGFVFQEKEQVDEKEEPQQKKQPAFRFDRAKPVGDFFQVTSTNPVITALKTVDKSTAKAGDTLTYTITVHNAGADANDVNIIDEVDENTTVVANAMRVSPVTVNDTYTSIGNVGIIVPAANGVLANDFIGTPAGTLTAVSNAATTGGGKVTLNVDGSFTYDPAPGYAGFDTATYVVTNSLGTSTGRIIINVTNPVWFIRSGASPVGANGTLQNPFDVMAKFNAINTGIGNNAKDSQHIFLYGGSYTGPLVLRRGQKVTGQSVPGSFASVAGITVPPYSRPLPAIGGTEPVITSTANGITLANNNTVRGIKFENCSAIALEGGTVGDLTIGEMSFITNGQALSLKSGTVNGTISSLTSTGGANNILLQGINGTLNIPAGAISNASGNAGLMINGGNANLSFGFSNSTNTAQQAITIQSITGGTIQLTGNISGSGAGRGILVQNNTGGTINFTGTTKTLHTAANSAINLLNNSNTSINFTGGNLVVSTTTGTALNATGPMSSSASIQITGTGNAINSTSGSAIIINNCNIGAGGLTFQSVSAANTSRGIALQNTGTANGLTITGTGTTAGSGGTIQNITNRGVEMINTRNISLNNMQFTNANTADAGNVGICDQDNNAGCFAAVYLRDVTNVLLNRLVINNTAEQGINGNNVTDLSITNCTLTNNGVAAFGGDIEEGALKLRDIKGNCFITNSSFTLSQYRIAHIINTTGTSKLTISGSTFDNNTVSGYGQDAFEMRTENSANATLVISNSTFSRATTKALQVFAEDNSVINMSVTNSTIDRQGGLMAGIEVGADQNATMNANVDNNPLINGAGEVAMNLYASVNGNFQATARNNNNIQSHPTTNYAFATVRAFAGNDAQSKVLIENNTISNTDQQGILVTTVGGTNPATDGRIDATIRANNISTPNLPGTLEAIEIRNGAGGSTPTYNVNCANIRNNTVNVAGSGRALRVRTTAPGNIIRLEGSGANVSALWTNNGNTNTGGTIAQNAVPSSTLTIGTDPANTCILPTNLTVVSRLSAPASIIPSTNIVGEDTATQQQATEVRMADEDSHIIQPTEQQPVTDAATIASSDEEISISGITLQENSTMVIEFKVRVNDNIPAGVCLVSNQATISGTGFTTLLSDNDLDAGNGINATQTTIQSAPVITAGQSDIVKNADAGVCVSSTMFGITAQGCPAPVITYTLAGAPITAPYAFPVGVSTVTATASNGIGNDTSITFTVTVNAVAPVITAQPAHATVCAGANTSFSALATGSNLTYQWQVNTGSGFTDITNNATYSNATTNTLTVAATEAMNWYQYRVEVKSCGDGSVRSNAATLTVNASPVITSQPVNTIGCEGNVVSFTVGSMGTPAPSIQWQWSTDNGATYNNITGAETATYSTTATIAANGYRYRAVVTNNCGSVTSNAAILSVGNITATVSATGVSCNGGSNGTATVVVSGGTAPYNYSWSPSGGTAATATGLAAGTYMVTVTDDNSCQTTETITVTQPAAITATVSATGVSCNGGSNGTATVVVSGGTAPYNYSWSPSGGTAATATGLAAETYMVTVTDDNSCQTTETITITQPAVLSINIAQTNVTTYGGADGSATVTVSGGTGSYTYNWSPTGGSAATATGLSAGVYEVTITDANGCTATGTVTITQPVASSNADLINLSTSTGTLTPVFAPATTSYVVQVANSVQTITVIPTVADATASITVNGASVTSGNASGAINLSLGTTNITVVVTAQDGGTKTYNIAVVRALIVPSTPDLTDASDNGFSNTDNITNIATPTFTGNADAGATVTLYNGATALGNAVADGSGIWNITASTMSAGVYHITAKSSLNGEESAESAALQVTIDLTNPEVTSINRHAPMVATPTTPVVVYQVQFTENVYAISAADFALHTTGTVNAVIGSISATSGNVVEVTVHTITGDGTLRLDIVTANGISDMAGNPLSMGYTAGEEYLINSSVMPVTLVNFTGAVQGSDVMVKWTTAQEININRYVVEYSANGSSFSSIKEVIATGSITSSYQYLDVNPGAGTHFYRLRRVENDETFTYSGVVKVTINKTAGYVRVYPNPVESPIFHLQMHNLPKGEYDMLILGMNGQAVYRQKVNVDASATTLQVVLPRRLNKGIYNIQLRKNKELHFTRFTVQ